MNLIVHAVSAALMALQSAPVQSGPLTLDEAIAIAERNAFSVRLQQTTVEQNRQRVAEAKANLGPKVTVNGQYTRYSEERTSNFGGQTVVTQGIDSKSANIGLTMPIDIAGNLNRLVRAAREQVEASRHTLRATSSDVRLSTRQAYYNVLRSEGLVVVAQQSVADAQERLDQARVLYEQDQIARVDVTRFESQLAQANTDLVTAQNTLQLAEQQFNLVLARPIETPVQLVPVSALPQVEANPTELVTTAQTQRAEVLALSDSLDALALIRRAQEAGMNPSLSVSLQHQRTFGAAGGFGASDQQTFGTLNLSIPVFDSGLTRARVKAARQDEERARINLEQVKLGISQEVRTALANLESARARLTSAESQVRLAEEVFRLAKVRQDAGAGTYIEVIDAETTLTQARNQVVTARYDYLTSFAQLQRAVGADDLAPISTPESGDPQ